VWMVTTTVFCSSVVEVGITVVVAVLVIEIVGRVVTVEVLQPGVVSMHEQSVWTNEEACFWSDEKMGASLSLSLLLVRLVKVGAHVVTVATTVLASVMMTAVGVLSS
jgi:hypothetical protein